MAYETAEGATSPSPDGHDGEKDPGECAMVKRFQAEDDAAEKFEKKYRKDWKSWRDYVSGKKQRGYTVQVNVIQPKLNTVLTTIYARNPTMSCVPADSVTDATYKDTQAFCKTLQIVCQRAWKKGKLKMQAKRSVRSAQTVALGWIKGAFCTDTIRDPLMMTKMNSLQDNIKTIDALIAAPQEGMDADDLAAQREAIQLQMDVLQAGSEREITKGMAIDSVKANDLLVCSSVRELLDYCEAPWMRQNIFMLKETACKKFFLTKEQIKGAKTYRMPDGEDINEATPIDVSTGGNYGTSSSELDWVCVKERWSLEDGLVYQWIAGCDYWLAPPQPPQFPTDRFYPYFLVAYNWVDDRRYPTSDVENMAALQDEWSGRRSGARTARERSKGGLMINGQVIDAADAARVTSSDIGENTVLQNVAPESDLNKAITQKPVPIFNPALYDTADINRELEMVSGAQDAASGSVQTAKTATEAEILQHGNQGRSGEKVDCLDDVMSEFAFYTAQQAIQAYTLQEVIKIAGPGAVWPELSLEDFEQLVAVDIEAGSMGAPNTTQERQAWTELYPMIQQTANEVAQLVASKEQPGPVNPATGQPGPNVLVPPSPDQIQLAKNKKALLEKTLEIFDERLSVDDYIPPIPEPPQQPGVTPPGGGGFGPSAPNPSPLTDSLTLQAEEAALQRGVPA